MRLDILFISVLIIFGCLLLATIGLVIRKQFKSTQIRLFGFLMGVNALYILGYAFELAASSLEVKLVFNHIQYFGLPYIAPLWLMMCFRLYKKKSMSFRPAMVLLFLIPTVTLALNLTHTINGLLYSAYQEIQWGGIDVLVFTKGVWYYVEVVYKALLLGVSGVLYLKAFIRSSGIRKKQLAYMLALSIIGFLLAASSVFSTATTRIDFVCILLSISLVLVGVSLFKYELLGLMPLAYSRLFDVLDQPILILSESMAVVKPNAEAEIVFAHPLNAHKKPLLYELFDDKWVHENTDESEDHIYLKLVNGQERYFSVNLISLDQGSADSTRGYIAVLTDMTSHIEQVKSLESLAAGDPLTGLYNRRHFFTVASQIFSEANASRLPVSLVEFDIDHFKDINDAFGHQAGDYVLRSVSEAISHELRNNDVLARFGGDEFVLMLESTNTETACMVANRICSAVSSRDYIFDNNKIGLTLSAGVGGGYTTLFKDLEELMSYADNALYKAKSTGRNRVCINTEYMKKG